MVRGSGPDWFVLPPADAIAKSDPTSWRRLRKMNKPIMPKNLAFIDLERQRARLGPDLDNAIRRVLEHGNYIMGPEVRELETALSEFCGARHSITCSNGTDALGLILMALGLGPGDAVLCPSFTFAATAEAVAWFGATPVFVDVDEHTFNLDP